jgi:hypothetical protein
MTKASTTHAQQLEFIARGTASLLNAKASNTYVEADALLDTLERKLAAAKARLSTAPKPRLP